MRQVAASLSLTGDQRLTLRNGGGDMRLAANPKEPLMTDHTNPFSSPAQSRDHVAMPRRPSRVAQIALVAGILPAGVSTVNDSIRPFQFHASEQALNDLRQRVAATQWPDKETVADQS